MELERMYIAVDPENVEALSERVLEHLKYLFKNQKFIKKVEGIREKFRLPARGIKGFLAVTDKANDVAEKINKKKFKNWMSLKSNPQYVKDCQTLRQDFNLPNRFDEIFTDLLIPFGKFGGYGKYLSKSVLRIYKDKGEYRFYIEIFGDTTKKDLEEAWDLMCLKDLKKSYKLKGDHLSKQSTYYLGQMLCDGAELTDKDMDYAHMNIIKHRTRKKNYSK